MRGGFASTDNSNALFVRHVRAGMNNEQDYLSSDHTDRVPSLLPVFKAVGHDEMEWIIEDLPREIKSDTVLDKVASGFFRVPLELQIVIITYKYVCTIP